MTDFINGIKKSLKEHNIDFRYYNDKRKNGRRIKISFVTEIEGKEVAKEKAQQIIYLDNMLDLCAKANVMNVARRRYSRNWFCLGDLTEFHYEDYLFYLDN